VLAIERCLSGRVIVGWMFVANVVLGDRRQNVLSMIAGARDVVEEYSKG
jgi:nickel-dependent lactate racemase